MSSGRVSRLQSLVAELKRRRVFRATAVYLIASFAVLQAIDILVPALHLPGWTTTLVVVMLIIGLPLVVGLAWAFDVTPEGVQRTAPVGTDAAPDGPTAMARGPAPSAAAAAAASAPRPAATEASIAVVPFLNLSGDPENEYFADGITEDIIAHLSKASALKVISRTSVMQFKKRDHSLREMGAMLGARTVLDGSVRRVGDRVRIVAQLVDAQTDQHLWAETYDRRLTDIFGIQTDVALNIAAALSAELSPDERSRIDREPTSNLEAYQLYLKGRHWFIRFTPEALRRAIDYFDRAVAVDPTYALAYANAAMAYAELAESGAMEPAVARHRATEAADRALRTDPYLGQAHCTMAYLRSLWDFDWEAAEAGFRRAIELCPNSADAYDLYGRMCSALERFDEALALQRRAQELDPLAHRLDVATTLLRAGRYGEAAAETERALDFEADYDRAHATLGWALFKQGRTGEGIAELRRAVDLAPDSTQWLAQLGQALALGGRGDEARDILRRLEQHGATPYHLAFVHTGLGEHERALDLLERSLEERAGAIYGIRGSFLFAPLRSHPRFQALLDRLDVRAA